MNQPTKELSNVIEMRKDMKENSLKSSKNGKKKTDWSSLPHTFKKGNPGGPGRPMGSRNKATIALEQMGENNAMLVYQKLIDLALGRTKEGDPNACKYILDKVMPPRKGAKIMFGVDISAKTPQDLLSLSLKVTNMMVAGELSPEEAVEIGKVIEQRLKVITDTDIIQKIEKTCERVKGLKD